MNLFRKSFFSNEIPKNSLKYWFFHFTSYSRRKIPVQLMFFIFNSNKEKCYLEYNRRNVKSRNDFITVGWIFDRKINRLCPQKVVAEFKENKIICKSKNFYLALKKKGKNLELEVSYLRHKIYIRTLKKIKPKNNEYESVLLNTISGISRNYFSKAKINGNYLLGNLFIQSIKSWLALPWNWCRITFSDKSYLGLSAFYLLTKKLRVVTTLNFYNAYEKKLYKFSIKKLRFYRGSWFIEAKANSNWLYVELKTLSLEPLKFKTLTTFNYNEHIVLVKNIRFKVSGKWKNLNRLGVGSGILEDTSGLLF